MFIILTIKNYMLRWFEISVKQFKAICSFVLRRTFSILCIIKVMHIYTYIQTRFIKRKMTVEEAYFQSDLFYFLKFKFCSFWRNTEDDKRHSCSDKLFWRAYTYVNIYMYILCYYYYIINTIIYLILGYSFRIIFSCLKIF